MLILGIDTSGKTASVALCDEDNVIAQSTVLTKLTHSQVIMPICNRVLESAGVKISDVDVIACAKGPGSYTGLRIGIAAVKAMTFAINKKCCGISTLESLAYNFSGIDTKICAVMHARLDLVYTAVFSSDGNKITRITDDKILSVEQLDNILNNYDSKVMLVGDYAKEYYEKACEKGNTNLMLAPPHLRLQLASSLCFASLNAEHTDPELLNAEYMQITKAEKDLNK